MLETEDINYARLAAYVDSDGTIGIAKQPGRKKWRTQRYVLRLVVSNTRRELPEWCLNTFNCGSIQSNHGKRFGDKTLYHWVVGSRDTVKLLEKIKPYLIIKREQADLGLEFYDKCVKGGNKYGRGGVSMWMVKRREEYHQKMKELHK